MVRKERVYIAGCGCISCAGDGREETLRKLYAPPQPPGPPPDWVGTSLKIPLFALKQVRTDGASRTLVLLDRAIREAFADTSIPADRLRKLRTGRSERRSRVSLTIFRFMPECAQTV